MIISSKSGELRLMMSRWPFVGGSNEPGKIARLIIEFHRNDLFERGLAGLHRSDSYLFFVLLRVFRVFRGYVFET